MKFGFEHDAFPSSDDDEEQNVQTEQTPLLANSNVAPTADPAVAEATTTWKSQYSSVHEAGTEQHSTTIETTNFERTNPFSTREDHAGQDSTVENTAIERTRSSSAHEYQAESTPLTSTDTTIKNSTTHHGPSHDKPLPLGQMLLLCFDRLIEPIAFFSIFPYINQMCVRNGNIPPSDTGFYAGLIESLFSLTQMCVMILWGRLADRYGRKPILVVSLYGVAFATALFGLAQTIWQMILFRCIAGMFAGTIVTIRTMITEHSTPKTQARAFSWFAFSGNLGILFGPLAGGALADPNAQFPRVFHHVPFFERFPYALATFFTGGIALVAAILTTFFAEETLRSRKGVINKSDPEPASASASSDEDTSTLHLLKSPGVLAVLYLYGHCMLLGFAYTAVLPIFMFEPISLGGFGFSSFYISIYMALIGASQAIWLLLIFPPLQHRIGTGGVLRLCANAWPLIFACAPLLNLLLRQRTQATTTLFWILSPILLAVGVGVSMAFTAIQLALNDISPSPRTLGTLNALALTLISGLRAIGPAAFASILATGIRDQIVWGYLIWLILIILALGLTLGIRLLPEKAEGRIYEESRQDEEQEEQS